MAASPGWTRPADVRAAIGRKWRSGALLRAYAAGEAFEPAGVPIRGPAAAAIGSALAAVREWAAEWERAGRGPLRVEYKKIGGRVVGTNMVPARAWLDGYDQVWELLGSGADVRRLTETAQATKQSCPLLVAWVHANPMKALRLADRWDKLLATVAWIEQRQSPGMYLRQVDVPGVDTKFIEGNHGVLAELLDLQLPPGRADPQAADFAGRYGFRRKPTYVRFRTAGHGGFSELTVRADELTRPPAGVSRALVLENEITYLAVPCPADMIVIFGNGYQVAVLEALPWLAGLKLTYWGDIDTHGFAILNWLRHHFPAARSVLMDRATLLGHRDQWVTEPAPATAVLSCLDAAEQDLYDDLVAGTLGPAVRLEQERVSFAAVERALADLG